MANTIPIDKKNFLLFLLLGCYLGGNLLCFVARRLLVVRAFSASFGVLLNLFTKLFLSLFTGSL
jgi:hypothetical protein